MTRHQEDIARVRHGEVMAMPISPSMRRVVLVDASILVRHRLRRLIEEETTARVVGEAAGVSDGVPLILGERPDVVVLDLSLADGSGMDVLEQVRHRLPGCQMIVLTTHTGAEHRVACEALGANHVLEKNHSFDAIVGLLGGRANGSTRARTPATPSPGERDRARFEQLVQSIDGIVWEADAGTFEFTFVSDRSREILGYPPSAWLAAPQFWVDHIHPDDRADAVAYCASRTADGANHTFEYRMVAADGRTVWIRDIVSVVRPATGPAVLRGIMVDITRERATRQRVDRLSRMHRMLGGINQALLRGPIPGELFQSVCRIAVEDARFRMAWVAQLDTASGGLHLVAQSGADPETQVLIRSLLTPVRPEEGCLPTQRAIASREPALCNDIANDPTAAHWRPGALSRGYRAMISLPLTIGRERDVFGALNLYSSETGFFDAEEVRLLKELAADISFGLDAHFREERRRAAETALRASEERFRELAETIREVFWMRDAARTRTLYVSPAYETIWGRSPQSLYDDPQSWLWAVHPEDRERVLASTMLRQTDGTYDEEYRILRPDGEIRWIREAAFPVRGATGRVERIVGVARDVTDRKHIEEQLRRLQRMEVIGRIAAGIAHDFNNVLTVVNNSAELALEGLDAASPVRQDIDAIRDAGKRGAQLTKQLLAFSRTRESQPQVLDLNVVIADAEPFLRRMLGPETQLVIVRESRLGHVLMDSGQFQQVLLNLAVNAKDAMPTSGVLTIRTQNVERKGSAAGGSAGAPMVVITVQDTGAGMDPATKARLFEPFFTTKPEGRGTGLGLATVLGILQQCGGDIEVESEPGRGTIFTIYLPVAPASEGA